MSKSKQKVIYANSINLSGLYSTTPIKCTLRENGEYWDASGNYEANPGFELYNVTSFSSTDEKEVIIWTQGVLATMKLMGQWCGASK